VLVVDEAAMVATRKLTPLLSNAERAGAKVVLVGDDRQFASIAAGGGFRALRLRLGALLAHRRIQQERLLLRVSRIAEVAQQTILRPIPPRMGRVAGRDDRQAIGAVRVLAFRGLRRLAGQVEAAGLARV
jgi:hypothetical protein